MEPIQSRIYTVDFILSLENKYRDRILQSETIDKFVELYKDIISQDAINPVFSLTTQYSKFPNSKIKKFKKFNNNLYIKSKDAWIPYGKVDDNQKLLQTIKATLNKISHRNYGVLYDDLLNSLMQYQDVKILDTLSIEFYQKAIYDIGFQAIYVDICNKLWNNTEWQDNLYTVIAPDDESNKLYWYSNDNSVESPDLHGPYKSENDLHDQVRKKINFKVHFLNFLQNQFQNRKDLIEQSNKEGETDEELRYKIRRKIFGPLELIGKLYWKKYIPQSILHVAILKLLSYQDNNPPLEEEIESFCILWKIIDHGKNIPFKPVLIHQYMHLVKDISIKNKNTYSTRINYLIQDVLNEYYKKYDNDNHKIKLSPSPSPELHLTFDFEKTLYQYLKDHDLNTVVNILQEHQLSKEIEEVIDNIFYLVCENPKECDKLLKLWEKLSQNKYFININFKQICDNFMINIDDIEVDCPHARNSLKKFIDSISIMNTIQKI